MQQFDELSHITLGDAFKSLIKFTFTTGLELREVELNDVEVGRSEKCWNGHVDMIGGGEDSTMPLHLQKKSNIKNSCKLKFNATEIYQFVKLLIPYFS